VVTKVTKHDISGKLSGSSRSDPCVVTNIMKAVAEFANQLQRQLK